jgi:hypothetical protein
MRFRPFSSPAVFARSPHFRRLSRRRSRFESSGATLTRSPEAQHHERANVRQQFGPVLRIDFGYVALASPRLMNGERRSGERTLVQPIARALDVQGPPRYGRMRP